MGCRGRRIPREPLEAVAERRLLSRVSKDGERAAARAEAVAATAGAGAVAAASAAGALVAFGARAGDPLRHVNALAGLLLDSRVSFVAGPHALVTTVGVLVLVVLVGVWGALFAAGAIALGARRGGALALASCTVAALAFCVDAFVLPRLAGETGFAALSLPRLALVHLLLAAAFPVGMRLALSGRHSTSDDALGAPWVYRSGDDG